MLVMLFIIYIDSRYRKYLLYPSEGIINFTCLNIWYGKGYFLYLIDYYINNFFT